MFCLSLHGVLEEYLAGRSKCTVSHVEIVHSWGDSAMEIKKKTTREKKAVDKISFS